MLFGLWRVTCVSCGGNVEGRTSVDDEKFEVESRPLIGRHKLAVNMCIKFVCVFLGMTVFLSPFGRPRQTRFLSEELSKIILTRLESTTLLLVAERPYAKNI